MAPYAEDDRVTGPGPIFWGLFLACALILLAYAVWMVRTERDE
jgi:hypothetical protein